MPRLLLLNHALLFLCCSILLGAGLSLFCLDPAPAWGAAAARCLDILALIILVTGLIMLLSEWFTGIRWVPLVVLLALAGWTMLPILSVAADDRDRIRIALWAVQWAAMMYWFCRMAAAARADR